MRGVHDITGMGAIAGKIAEKGLCTRRVNHRAIPGNRMAIYGIKIIILLLQ